jgi:hypothetical protein
LIGLQQFPQTIPAHPLSKAWCVSWIPPGAQPDYGRPAGLPEAYRDRTAGSMLNATATAEALLRDGDPITARTVAWSEACRYHQERDRSAAQSSGDPDGKAKPAERDGPARWTLAALRMSRGMYNRWTKEETWANPSPPDEARLEKWATARNRRREKIMWSRQPTLPLDGVHPVSNCVSRLVTMAAKNPGTMIYRTLVVSVAVALTAVSSARPLSAAADAAAVQPNVVVILADDQGWGDLGIHGNRNLSTPSIDSLARDGALFEQFFVSPVCSPTRDEFLTGRYHPRGGIWSTSTGGERLDLDEKTIAESFRAAGYATGAFGKWHNGSQFPYHPNARGFAEYYGFCSGHWGDYFSPPLEQNGKMVRGNGYITDDLTTHALKFIEKNSRKPFFCYLPFNSPHSPMQVPDRFWDKFRDAKLELRYEGTEHEDPDTTRAALAMCENIDWNVGRVLEKLEALKLAENTIILYFSDNGPNSWRWNGRMKGRKGASNNLLSQVGRDGSVVPGGQQFIKYNRQGILHLFGGIATGFIQCTHDIDRGVQPGASCGFSHQFHDRVQRVEEHARADARNVRK